MPNSTQQQFAELIATHDKGRTEARLSEELADLLAAIQETGKPGELTVTFKIAPQSGVSDAVTVTAQVRTKTPEHDPRGALFWITSSDGYAVLTRNDPHQLTLLDFERTD